MQQLTGDSSEHFIYFNNAVITTLNMEGEGKIAYCNICNM